MYKSIISYVFSPIKDEDTSWKLVTVLGIIYIFTGIVYLFPKFFGVSLLNSRSSSQGVILSMVNTGYYKEWIRGYHTYFFSHRFPFTVWIYSALAGIAPSNIAFALIIKNLIFIPILLASLVVVIRKTRPLRIIVLFSIFIVLLNPSFLHTSFNIDFEEGFTIPLLAAFYSFLFRAYYLNGRAQLLAFAWAGLIGAVLYLSKSSLIGICIFLPVTALLETIVRSDKRISIHHLRLGMAALMPVLVAMLMWGIFNESHTGEFRINSSSDGMNFYKGNNSAAIGYYPKDLDSLKLPLFGLSSHNEWRRNDQFQSAAIDFIVSHPKEWLSLTMQKAYVFFFDIERTPPFDFITVVDIIKAVFMFAFRIIFFGTLILAALRLFQKANRGQLFPILFYIIFLICYSVPFLAGFCYTRHVMPIMIPTLFLVFSISGGERRQLKIKN